MDKQLLDALNNLSLSLEKVAETLINKSEMKSPVGTALASGDFSKSLANISESISKLEIDTKKILDTWCVNASFIKINHVEYEHTKYNLKDLNIEDKLVVTLSNKGCQYKGKLFPVEKVQIKDVSGAGDTFLSGLVAEYILTKDIKQAILFAQQCATIVVQKQGVATI